MYELFQAVQEDLFEMKESEQRESMMEVRLFVMHYLLRMANKKTKKDIETMLSFMYRNYPMLAEVMKKNYKKGEGERNEIFQVSRWTDSIN
jgi:hypothetical protein